jgi:hypothetical protein
MGSETRKAQCTTLYVCDSNKEKCSQRLRLILDVLPCSILRIWRLWARTKNEYTMDDFSTFTIREPWLLQRISMSNASTWLAGKGIDAVRLSRLAARGQVDRNYQKIITKGKGRLSKEFHPSLCEGWLQVELQNNLAHTFTYFANLGFWQLIVLKVQYSSSWCDAYACAVWCSWCTLEWLVTHMMSQWLQGQSKVVRICVTGCYLTTKIPSALLVAVVWLQHTRYPRFHRGTFGYGITLSPIERGRAGGTEFACECTLVYPCFPNAYAMQCMLKINIYFNSQSREQGQRNKFRTEESIGSWLTRDWWSTELDRSQLA